LAELGRRGVLQVMVEGGPTLQGSFLAGGHVNELHLILGAKMLGGTAVGWPSCPLAQTISEARPWRLVQVKPCSDEGDILAIYHPPEA
jgi:riboflavin biosynthesis pyrimidine reductase